MATVSKKVSANAKQVSQATGVPVAADVFPENGKPVPSGPSSVQAKFAAMRRDLDNALIERSEEVDVGLTAMICQDHALLVGPPGTGKSLFLDSIMAWMNGRKFSILLTKFSTPEEVFGPISVKGLKEDRYRRITTGKLPEADLAFVDEVFKSSSAILNTLLRIFNERVYENGDGTFHKCPLKLAVAASNEWPSAENGGQELGALFDRFLFRKVVKPIVSASGRHRLLWERDHTPKLSTSITPAEVDQAHAEAMALVVTDQTKEALEEILRQLAAEGIRPGDRRQYKSVAAAQSFAYLTGADKVLPEHLEILAHVLWDDPTEQPAKCAGIVAKIANPVGMRVNALLMEVEAILSATDVKNLAQAATAASKLREVYKQLSAISGGNGRVEKAKQYVAEMGRKIKVATVESL